MSTRSHVEVWDGTPGDEGTDLGALLYHHSDGMPSAMIPCLRAHLDQHKERAYWWDSERIAAMLVAWSIGEYQMPDLDIEKAHAYDGGEGVTSRGVPMFHPCLAYHGDIEYLYRVYLHYGLLYEDKPLIDVPKVRVYTIETYEIERGWWDNVGAPPSFEYLHKIEVDDEGKKIGEDDE